MIAGLTCTVCRSPGLVPLEDYIVCPNCAQEYPIIGDVPVMFTSVAISRAEAVPNARVRELLGAFGLQDDPLTLLRLRTLMRKQVRFGNGLIQTESQQFIERVRQTAQSLVCQNDRLAPSEVDLQAVPRYRWTRSYMPRRFWAGKEVSANMRLENCGDVTICAQGTGHCTIAIDWKHRNGDRAECSDIRTPLPIDLHPGQAVTIAVRILPPATSGRYSVTLCLVQEQIRWIHDGALTSQVTVQHAPLDDVPAGWIVLPDPPADYDTDHANARAMLTRWLAEYGPARPRVLEIGGNAVPMISYLGLGDGIELINVDVDLLGLQVGQMIARNRGGQVRNVCADAFDLPFATGYFDAIVMFASLHHFPDPAALLEKLGRKLRPGGFIGVFCEPVGHVWPGAVDAPFLAELERGVNEQSFSLPEYALMFRSAELDAAEVRVDMNSLKARLTHKLAQGAQ